MCPLNSDISSSTGGRRSEERALGRVTASSTARVRRLRRSSWGQATPAISESALFVLDLAADVRRVESELIDIEART